MRVGPQFVHCFGCGFHGDSIEIVRKLFGLDAFGAMVKLNDDFNLGLPIGRKLTLRESMQIQEESNRIAQERNEQKRTGIEQLENKLDLEQRLFLMQDLADEFRPNDYDAPFHPLFVYANKQINQLKYLIECGG